MHNKTGHVNLRMLIEASKSKWINGLEIEDKHIRNFVKSDKHVCDICARANVFKNCPSRGGYLYVVQFLNHEIKFCWVYLMKTRDELIEKLRDVVDVQLVKFGADQQAGACVSEVRTSSLPRKLRRGGEILWLPAGHEDATEYE